eukprot:11637524-Alexandrium_andersonii.AAC.1
MIHTPVGCSWPRVVPRLSLCLSTARAKLGQMIDPSWPRLAAGCAAVGRGLYRGCPGRQTD